MVSRGARRDEFEAAFRELVPRARLTAQRILGDTREAEDAVAEAFCRLYLKWGRVGNVSFLDAWLLRVTANCAIDIARKRQRDARVALVPVIDVSFSEAVLDQLVLVEAARALPRRQREVVVMRYAAGMTEQQVADSLGVAVTTVREHSQRARAALRASLGAAREG